MKLLVNVRSDHGELDGRLEHLLLDVTHELAYQILRRHRKFLEARQSDPDTYEHYYWSHDNEILWLGRPDDGFSEGKWDGDDSAYEDATVKILGDRAYRRVSSSFSVPEEFTPRTECEQMVIREDGVHWLVICKHGEVYFTSDTVPYKVFEKIGAGAPA